MFSLTRSRQLAVSGRIPRQPEQAFMTGETFALQAHQPVKGIDDRVFQENGYN